MIRDKQVMVVPTRSVPQGISAMIAFNPDATADQNMDDMKEAITHVVSMSVTNAVRSTTVEGEQITSGQMLGLVDGAIDCVADSAEECLDKLADKMTDAGYILVFLGEGVSEDAAADVENRIRAKAQNADIAVMMGGQPLYPYEISVE